MLRRYFLLFVYNQINDTIWIIIVCMNILSCIFFNFAHGMFYM